jgi:hypothetical protein
VGPELVVLGQKKRGESIRLAWNIFSNSAQHSGLIVQKNVTARIYQEN